MVVVGVAVAVVSLVVYFAASLWDIVSVVSLCPTIYYSPSHGQSFICA